MPSGIKTDVYAIVDEVYNPRDYPTSSKDRLEASVLDKLMKRDTAPDLWKPAVRAGLRDAIADHCLNRDKADMLASKLRFRKWEFREASEWEGWKAALGEPVKSFVEASDDQVKRATQVISHLNRLDELFARQDPDVDTDLPKKTSTTKIEEGPASTEPKPAESGIRIATGAWACKEQEVKGHVSTRKRPGLGFFATANGEQKVTEGRSTEKAPRFTALADAAGISVAERNTNKQLAPSALVAADAFGVNVARDNDTLSVAPNAVAAVSADGVRVNVRNRQAQAAMKASATASARLVEVDALNASAEVGLDASVGASARGMSVSALNARVDLSAGPGIKKSVEGFTVAVGNVNIAPFKFGVSTSFGGLQLCNFSIGGHLHFSLNPLDILNFGFGGSAGGDSAGGGQAGSDGLHGNLGGTGTGMEQGPISDAEGTSAFGSPQDTGTGTSVAQRFDDTQNFGGNATQSGYDRTVGGLADIYNTSGGAGGSHGGDHTAGGETRSSVDDGHYDFNANLARPKKPSNDSDAVSPFSQGTQLVSLVMRGELALRIVVTSHGQKHDALLLGRGRDLLMFDVDAVKEADFPKHRMVESKFLPGILKVLTGNSKASKADALKMVKILFCPAQQKLFKADDLNIQVTVGVLEKGDALIKKLTQAKIIGNGRDVTGSEPDADEAEGPAETQELLGMVDDFFKKGKDGSFVGSSFVRYVDQALQQGNLDDEERVEKVDNENFGAEMDFCTFCAPKAVPRCLACITRQAESGGRGKSGKQTRKLGRNLWGFQ